MKKIFFLTVQYKEADAADWLSKDILKKGVFSTAEILQRNKLYFEEIIRVYGMGNYEIIR